jgi:hypothetical protein
MAQVGEATKKLVELATGRLSVAERRALVVRALQDPAFAAELKLALRLADESSAIASAMVAAGERPARGVYPWRAVFAAALSLTAVALTLPWLKPAATVDSGAPSVAEAPALPDRIGAASFESDALGAGGFEPN